LGMASAMASDLSNPGTKYGQHKQFTQRMTSGALQYGIMGGVAMNLGNYALSYAGVASIAPTTVAALLAPHMAIGATILGLAGPSMYYMYKNWDGAAVADTDFAREIAPRYFISGACRTIFVGCFGAAAFLAAP
jgi:hypothetical protein